MYVVLNLPLDSSSSLFVFHEGYWIFLKFVKWPFEMVFNVFTGALFFKAVFAGVLDGIIIKK